MNSTGKETARQAAIARIGAASLRFSHDVTLSLSQDIKDELMLVRIADGNHAAWILGHLTFANYYFCQRAGADAEALTSAWRARFGVGSVPTEHPGDYPSKNELIAALETSHAFVLRWYCGLGEEDLAAPLPKPLAWCGPCLAALPSVMVWHAGLHQGQLTDIRRVIGLPRALG